MLSQTVSWYVAKATQKLASRPSFLTLNWTHFSGAKSLSFRNRVLRVVCIIDMVSKMSHFREICSFKESLVTSVTRAMQPQLIKATNLSVWAILLRATSSTKTRLPHEWTMIHLRKTAKTLSDSLLLNERRFIRFGIRIPTLMVFKS